MDYLKILLWGFWSIFLISCASGIPSKEKHHSSDTSGRDLYQGDYKCPKLFGMFPDPHDCTCFRVCFAGKSAKRKCPFFTRYADWSKSCVPAIMVKCGNDEDPAITVKEKEPDVTTEGIVETESTTQAEVTTQTELETTTEEITTQTELETTTEEITTTSRTTVEDIKTTTHRPTGPPDHTCSDDDADCIITETGDVEDWFICPDDVGSYVHPSSNKLFIFCMNWIPSAKKCGLNRVFSKEDSTCVEETYLEK